jgi:hypothetical protein
MDSEIDVDNQCKIMMGLSRCLYEVGNYETAILIGKPAIKLNRHYTGARHYMVLASKAQGDMDAATRLMAQAIIYEAPWDDNHQTKMERLWHELFVEDSCNDNFIMEGFVGP